MAVNTNIYDDRFFNNTIKFESRTAKAVVEIIIKYFTPKSVIDIGCGVGIYLAEFKKNDIGISGFDGSPAAIAASLVGDKIKLHDLCQPLKLNRQFDLCLCLEVAEHLPKTCARVLVEILADLSQTIIFTAATPGQGPKSLGHINEQPPEYWLKLFRRKKLFINKKLTEKIRKEMVEKKVVWWLTKNLIILQKKMKNNKLLTSHSFSEVEKIIIAAAEVTPIAKVGGLGDVIGALPKALNKLNLNARVIIPFYGAIDKNKYKIKLVKPGIKANNSSINLWQTNLPGSTVPVYLIEHKFFNGQEIYSSALADRPGDLEKYLFLSRAILQALKAINFKPGVIHLNDWHTAAVAELLKTDYRNDHFFQLTKTLFTIHNLANQGPADQKNYMAEGIMNSDLISTVSPTYAKEILTKEYGAGLEKILAKRKKQLYGILNGIDTDFFNPATDKLIRQKYSLKSLNKKSDNKLSLQQNLGLRQDKNIALVGLVTRFVGQKGVELITEKFSELNCQFVFLGTGEKKYENILLNLAEKYPDKFKVLIKFDEKLAHEIYAGSDIFLIPSRFEPCGLTQMIAMRYASVPIVRATGGLRDTVNSKVGFIFKKFDSAEFYKTLKKALLIYYHQPKTWRRLQLNGLKQNFSWDKSAKEYLKLYKKLLK